MSQTRQTYRLIDNVSGSQSNEFGNYILKRGAGEIRKPTWNRTETVVRFLPQWDFEENRWTPFRRTDNPNDFGDWIRAYDAVRGFGEHGVTLLLYDPMVENFYDINSNPCVILYRAIDAAITNRTCQPDWPSLFRGANGRRASLSKHQRLYVARAGIFRINSKDMASNGRAPLGLSASDPAFFLEMSKSTGQKLLASLEERDPKTGEFRHGDIVSLDRGAYVSIFQEGANPRQGQGHDQGAEVSLTITSGGRGNYGDSGKSFPSYDLEIMPKWNGFNAKLNSPEMSQLVRTKQRPWADCLQFFTPQEQAFMVQDGFPAGAILYAWRDHPEWIKDETRSKAVARKSALAGDRPAQHDGRQQTPQPPVHAQPAPQREIEIADDPEVATWGSESSMEANTPLDTLDDIVPSAAALLAEENEPPASRADAAMASAMARVRGRQ